MLNYLVNTYEGSPNIIIGHIIFLIAQAIGFIDLRSRWWKKYGRQETVFDRFGSGYTFWTISRSEEIRLATLKIIPVIITGIIILIFTFSSLAIGHLLFLHFVLMLARFGYLALVIWDGGYLILVPSGTDGSLKEGVIESCSTAKLQYYKIILGGQLKYMKIRFYISDEEAKASFHNI